MRLSSQRILKYSAKIANLDISKVSPKTGSKIVSPLPTTPWTNMSGRNITCWEKYAKYYPITCQKVLVLLNQQKVKVKIVYYKQNLSHND